MSLIPKAVFTFQHTNCPRLLGHTIAGWTLSCKWGRQTSCSILALVHVWGGNGEPLPTAQRERPRHVSSSQFVRDCATREETCQYILGTPIANILNSIQVLRSIGKGFLLLLTSQLHQSSAGVPTFTRLEPTHCHQSVVSAGMSHLLSVIKLGILTPSWSFVRNLVTHCNAATAQWKIFMRTSGISKHGLAECCHHDHST